MKFIKKLFNFRSVLILLLVLVLAFFLLVQDIDEPFWGHHEFNGVFYSNIARNYLRYGYIQTGFKEVTNYNPVSPEEFSYHTHHPPLFPLFLSLAFGVFAESEATARLVSIFFSLGFLAVFYLLAKKIFNVSQAGLLLLFGIFTPLFLYYGRLPVYEPMAIFFIILTVFFYLSWLKNQNSRFFLAGFLSLFLAQLTEWPSFYLGPILFVHQFIFCPKQRKQALFWLVSSACSFLVILMIRPSGSLLSIFTQRLTGGGGQPFTLIQFVRLELARLRSFFTTPLLVLTLLWAVGYIKNVILKFKIKQNLKKINPENHFIVFFLIFGLLHLIIFPNIAWYHDYMFYYFFPPVLLASFLTMNRVFSYFKSFGFLVFALILFLIFFEKRQFLQDLKNLNPHKDCVLWGIKISQGQMEPVVESKDVETVKICPPFTQYYAGQNVTFKLVK